MTLPLSETIDMNQRSPEPDIEIQIADPAARKRAIWLVFALIAIAGVIVFFLNSRESQINQWMANNAQSWVARPEILWLTAFVLTLPLLGGAVYVYRQGIRIVQAQRIPAPGQKVIKDTPVITGKKAIRQGRAMKFMAILMALFALGVPFGLVLIVMTLQTGI